MVVQQIKQLKQKPAEVVVHGFKERTAALEAVRHGVALYKEKFPNK